MTEKEILSSKKKLTIPHDGIQMTLGVCVPNKDIYFIYLSHNPEI